MATATGLNCRRDRPENKRLGWAGGGRGTGVEPSPLCQACIREQSQWLRLPKAKKGRLQRAAIATAPFKSPSASEMLSNPFGLYVHTFDCASNRVAGGALW